MSNLASIQTWGSPYSWREFTGRKGIVAGRPCTIITPVSPRQDLAWVWRPEFFDGFPNADEALVRRGFHLVYLDVQDQYGSPSAVEYGNALYAFVTSSFGFRRKVSFIALSRAGLWAYNWASANPEKVDSLYADNPVCDFKSWPAGWGTGPGNPDDWQRCLEAYGLTEEEAKTYRGNPIDSLARLAAFSIPILHVVGDADELVPIAENSDVIKTRYRALGGHFKEIVKPDGLHHPHGLEDPEPIVRFIEEYAEVLIREDN